LHLLLPPLVLT
jgi:hypothetical protein